MVKGNGVNLQNINGEPLSIYAQKFSEWSYKSNWISQGSQDTNWLGRKYTEDVIQLTMTRGTIEEMEYKGHQILVIGYHWEYQFYLDQHGVRISNTVQVPTATLEPTIYETSNYYAMGYRHSDSHRDLEWNGQDSLFSMVYVSTSTKATFKKAMKRIDLEDKLLAIKDDLARISGDRWNGGMRNSQNNEFAPYNAVVGDQVFVQAHGRLRKGIIVDTTGSRFVVGYVTPSNTREMKYKTLPLSLMYTTV